MKWSRMVLCVSVCHSKKKEILATQSEPDTAL